MKSNKTLNKALKICGYGNVEVFSTDRKIENGKVIGHIVRFFATRNGTAGNLKYEVGGIAILRDVFTRNPEFHISMDLIRNNGSWNVSDGIDFIGTIKGGLEHVR